MASYGGLAIFGTGVVMTTGNPPRETQVNSFFGVNGIECLDGGARGRITFVRGVLNGSSAIDLNNAESLFRSLHDGQARVLVDNIGNTWSNVRMLSYLPIGRIRHSANGVLYRLYVARFLHLN